MFKLMPRIPLTTYNICYEDALPYNLSYTGLKKVVSELWLLGFTQNYMQDNTYSFKDNSLYSERGKIVFLADTKYFDLIYYNKFQLKSKRK